MVTDFNKAAKDIFTFVGSEENILSVGYCMTRLRLSLKDKRRVDVGVIRNVDGVLGVVETQEQFQIIIECGKAKKLITEFINISEVRK